MRALFVVLAVCSIGWNSPYGDNFLYEPGYWNWHVRGTEGHAHSARIESIVFKGKTGMMKLPLRRTRICDANDE